MKVRAGFGEKLGANFGGELEGHRRMGLLRRNDARMMKVENRLGATPPSAIRVAVGFILFEPHRLADKNDLPPVCPAPEAYILLRIIRPALQAAS